MKSTIPGLFSASLTSFMLMAGVFVLWVAQSFFIPLVIALLLSLLIISATEAFSSIPIGPWRLPRPFGFLLTFLTLFFVAFGLSDLIQRELSNLVQVAPNYQERLSGIIDHWIQRFNLEPPSYERMFGQISVGNVLRVVLQTVSDIAGYVGLIALYVIFMILEYNFFPGKLRAAIGDAKRATSVTSMLGNAARRVQSYLLIKTALGALTAGISWVILKVVGVDFAGLWTALIFILNYIPNIGSIVACIFPSLLTLVQFPTFTPFLQVALGLSATQFLIGNVLEPRVMGQAFNLSGLVILLSLTFWGTLWGIVGMFLSVPLMVIAMILLGNFEQTRPVAIILSRDGDI